MDYQAAFKEYWSQPSCLAYRSAGDPTLFARQIESVFGQGSVLDVGCGQGELVRALAARGHDARGIDVASRPIDAANTESPGRFHTGSILALPFPAGSFDLVVSTDCLEHIAEADVPLALSELFRVARRGAFIRLATCKNPESQDDRWLLTLRDRTWWEYQFIRAGFRKHPLSSHITPYGQLDAEMSEITLLFEKVPARALTQFPFESLRPERDLHMDMLREPGRRSDAHTARYFLARQYLPKEGLVLDAACGLGYGSAILACDHPAVRVVGIDQSEFAIRYAAANFSLPNTEFRTGEATRLAAFTDNSVDLVVSFETLEHLPDPLAFLAEVRRVLKPGGRLIGSVPNQWVDENGRDPNPSHLHVFDFSKLAVLYQSTFDLEHVFAQSAGGGMKFPDAPRVLRQFNLPVTSGESEAEWWLMTGRKPAAPDPALLRRAQGRSVAVLTESPGHPYYSSWLPRCPFPVNVISPIAPGAEIPADSLLLVTHDTYREPSRSIIRRAVAQGVPTLILADGILEYRNTWEHPQNEPGAVFQPVLGHKLAALGALQARVVESWNNPGKCEITGSPRFDPLFALRRRQRPASAPFRILIATALTPHFTEEHRWKLLAGLWDLHGFFSRRIAVNGVPVEPVWRLTAGLHQELKVPSCGDRPLAEILQEVDAVITTPSTTLLEAMLLGLPAAILDYTNSPHYVQAAWRITAPAQIEEITAQLAHPPEPKLLFQETLLHDALACSTPAVPRLIQLITEMARLGLEAREQGVPLHFPAQIIPLEAPCAGVENRFRPERLCSSSQPVPARDAAAPALAAPAADITGPRPKPAAPAPRDAETTAGTQRELEQALSASPQTALSAKDASPADAGAWHILGRARFEQGDLDGSLEAFARACDLDSGQPFAHLHHSLAELPASQLDAAENRARRALDLSPDNAGASSRLLAMDQPPQTAMITQEHDLKFERALVAARSQQRVLAGLLLDEVLEANPAHGRSAELSAWLKTGADELPAQFGSSSVAPSGATALAPSCASAANQAAGPARPRLALRPRRSRRSKPASSERKPFRQFFADLQWHPDRLVLGSYDFLLQHKLSAPAAPDAFIFYKTPGLVEQYAQFFAGREDFQPQNMFELGLWDGGSAIFWHECFKPEKHVGIDIQPKADTPCLQRYRAESGVNGTLKTFWSTDQTNQKRLVEIVQTEMDGPLDLVIDDASHLYRQTKASFEALFPLVRPGGIYIIEDWAWGHWQSFQGENHPWRDEIPLTRLITELVEIAGAHTHLITSIDVRQGFTAVTRGPVPTETLADFQVEKFISRKTPWY